MVLEWTLGQDRSSQLQHQSTSQGNMGDSEPPAILCESCACIIHINLQSCMSIISETLHDQSFSHISHRFQAGYRTKGQETVYETCACVIHTILLSYMCINIVSHSH